MCLIFLLTYLLTWTIGAAVVSFVHTEYLTVKQLYTDNTLLFVINLVGWLPAVALMLYAERHLDD